MCILLDSPLLQFIENMLNVIQANKGSAVLNNAQLINIINIDLNYDIQSKPDLNRTIYLNIVKHFLKTWTNWEQFDKLAKTNPNNMQQVHQKLYENLKQYLVQVLTQTDDIIQLFIEDDNKKVVTQNISYATEDSNDVEMEVFCTRTQFNNLIYRQPHPKTGTIFNITKSPHTSKISVRQYTFAQIINWPNVQVSLSLPEIDCIRVFSPKIVRTLMNMKRPENKEMQKAAHPLDADSIYYRKNHYNNGSYKTCIMKIFEKLNSLSCLFDNPTDQNVFQKIVEEFEKDCRYSPKLIKHGEYKVTMHDYKYVRYLCTESDIQDMSDEEELEGINREDYDLQIQEMLSPYQVFQIKREKDSSFNGSVLRNSLINALSTNYCYALLRCITCNVSFALRNNLEEVLHHFNECHEPEPNWECTGCHKSFAVTELAENRWTHPCVKSQ